METVNIHDAKTRLSQLIADAVKGKPFVDEFIDPDNWMDVAANFFAGTFAQKTSGVEVAVGEERFHKHKPTRHQNPVYFIT